jgi:hypothetical protein
MEHSQRQILPISQVQLVVIDRMDNLLAIICHLFDGASLSYSPLRG